MFNITQISNIKLVILISTLLCTNTSLIIADTEKEQRQQLRLGDLFVTATGAVVGTAVSDALLFFNAVINNDFTRVSQLIEKNRNIVNAKTDIWGLTALHVAARNGFIEMVKLLIEKGADVNAKTNDGVTALHEAAQNGFIGVVKLLIEKGANINAKDNKGATALHEAARQSFMECSIEIVKLLIEKGADVNAKAKLFRWTYSTENGANEKISDGATALYIAVSFAHFYSSIEMVKLLIDKGADVNAKTDSDGATALHVAAQNGFIEIVKLLIEKGANVNAKDNNGVTALP